MNPMNTPVSHTLNSLKDFDQSRERASSKREPSAHHPNTIHSYSSQPRSQNPLGSEPVLTSTADKDVGDSYPSEESEDSEPFDPNTRDPQEDLLKTHYLQWDNSSPNYPKGKPVQCLVCAEFLESRWRWETHWSEKHLKAKGKPYECRLCGKKYSVQSSWNAHAASYRSGEGCHETRRLEKKAEEAEESQRKRASQKSRRGKGLREARNTIV